MNDVISKNHAPPPGRRGGPASTAIEIAAMEASTAPRRPGSWSRNGARLLAACLALFGTGAAQAFNPDADSFVTQVATFPDGDLLIAGSFTTVGGQPRDHYARLNPDGSVDAAFHNSLVARDVHAIAVQPDGKALIGGKGVQGNGGLLRLNADGSVDSSFVDAATGGTPAIRSIALQADGRILIGGDFLAMGGQPRTNLARLNPDGSLDTSFDAGTLGLSLPIESIAVQADGRILIAGYGTLLRLLPNGQADTGQPLPPVAADANLRTLKLQADGKILLGAGYGFALGGVDRGTLVRLHADGSVDTAFLPNVRGDIDAIAIDGSRIVIAGSILSVGGVIRRNLARLNSDGSLDASLMDAEMNAAPVYDVALQADGKLVLGAHFSQINGLSRNRIARLHADGRVDNAAAAPLSVTPRVSEGGSASPAVPQAVSEGGKALFTFTPAPGRVLASVSGCGEGRRSGNDYLTGWVYADCTVSASFVPEANAVFDPAPNANVESIEVQADGRILAAGWFTRIGGRDRLKFARLAPTDGAAEANFADGSGIYQEGNTGGSVAYAVAPQADGKILFGGEEGLIRNNADGSRDTTFAAALGPDAFVEKVIVQPDGAILVAGRQLLTASTVPHLVRLHANGALDTGFSADFGEDDDISIYSLLLEPNGRILVGGGSVNGGYLGRLNADGSLQTLFPATSTIADVTALHRLADGRYLVGAVAKINLGDGSPVDSQLVRLLANGTRDPSFIAQVDGGLGGVKSIAVQPDGAILIGGGFRTIGGVVRPNLARLSAAGELEAGFTARPNTWVKDIALQSDGKILIAGYFSQVSGLARRGLARLKPDGRIDVDAFVITPLAGANGTIAPNTPQEALPGTQTQFTLVPDPGYVIGAVTGCAGTLNGLVYTTGPVSSHCTVTVEFLLETVTYTVIPAAGAHGAIVPALPQSVLFAQTTSFQLVPDAGYYLAGVEGCGGTLSANTYTTDHILANCSVVARFHKPAVLTPGSGAQSTAINTAFATPLTVRVSDANGQPVNGAVVNFSAPASGASATLSASSAVSGADGLASITARANGQAGSFAVTASVPGVQASFALTNESAAQGGIELQVTVSTLPPPACGTATHIAVTPGEPVNYCFTLINRSSVTLNYHTLTMLTGAPFQYEYAGWDRLFDLLPQAVPPGGSFRYNHVVTAGTRDQSPRFTWNATASRPGYEQGSDPAVVFSDIRTTGTALTLGAKGVYRLGALPFPFSFYGQYFHEGDSSVLCINNSGTLTLRTADDTDGCPEPLVVPPPFVGDNDTMAAVAHARFPFYGYNGIAAYWDLLGGHGAVYYATVGTAPNRRLIVQWDDKDHALYPNQAGGITFQTVLEEGTGRIHYVYRDLTFDVLAEPNPDFGGSATVGLVGFTPMTDDPPYREYAFNSATLAEGQVITWTPVDVPRHASGAVAVDVGAPRLSLAAAAISAQAGAGEQTSATLRIGNAGEIDLLWSLQEAQARAHFPPTDLGPWLADLQRSDRHAYRAAAHQSAANAASASAPDSVFAVPAYANARNFWNGFNLGAISFDASRPDRVVQGTGIPMHSGDYLVADFAGNDFTRIYTLGSYGGDIGLAWSDTNTLLPTSIGDAVMANAQTPPYMRWSSMAWDSRTHTMFATTAADLGSCAAAAASDLYRLDLQTAQATFVAPVAASVDVCIRALAVAPDGALYGIDDFNNSLVAIDKNTGAAAVVGPLGFPVEGANLSADFDESSGVLYLANGSRLYTVNRVTGAATLVGPPLLIGNEAVRIDGLSIAVAGGDCAVPGQVPWLRVQQTAGTTPPGAQAQISVDLDARELAPGLHQANLCVFSNDRTQSLVRVPVALTVTAGGDAIFASGFEARP
ncbi:Ig-like domain-containing protein [Tahibacter harae]|uniref:Ig-like domain-containing protein n=1 Tax=Tahibacter harae TaxID=2963937 RepID=A0ABT1QL84_9GAMM|nr:Ig-like domain-containing protein [Tahibacter harae]MCQ4163274.1 Ig-like domain-containing protein [Tahibacter harae]